jgi:hypothetical protein
MGTEVVNWKERLATSAKDVAALERPQLSTISLRGGFIQYMGQPVPGNKLDVVVVASGFQKRYYDKPFDANKPVNPVCFALSLDGQDMVPSDESTDKQAETCDACPMGAWGSDPKGGRGKACKDARRLVVIPVAALTDDEAVKKAEMAMITLPVMSQKYWANYVNQIASEYERPPWGMITQITTKPDPKAQFLVQFNAVGTVAEQFLGPVHGRIEMAQQTILTPYEENQQAPEPVKPKDGKKY